MKTNEVYEKITQDIISSLEKGNIPWMQPWKESNMQLPMNYKTGKQYNGINTLLLMMREFSSPYWVTFKQAQAIGGKVKKGSKASTIIYWQMLEFDAKVNGQTVKDQHGNVIKDTVPMLKYSKVFNLDDIEGYKAIKNRGVAQIKDFSAQFVAIAECESIIENMKSKPVIEHHENKAYYVEAFDKINMPKHENFKTNHGYYAVLFHELTHSTGHKDRLKRNLEEYNTTKENRSKEELIAELGSCFLCAETGINNDVRLENAQAYINGWISVLKNEPKFIIEASKYAQKAVNYILNK